MDRISAVELKEKLDAGSPLQLVAVVEEYTFKTSHIPGSLFFESPKDALSQLDKSVETVVYCSGPNCISAPFMGNYLIQKGFEKVRLFSGGLEVWEEAGFPLVKGSGF